MLDGARIFHVNVNCSDLEVSRAFYVDRCGLIEGVRTTPAAVQSGAAFGLRPRPLGRVDPGGRGRLRRRRRRSSRMARATTERRRAGADGMRVRSHRDRGDRRTSRSRGTAVRCADRDRSLAFYDALGFRAPDSDTDDELALDAPGGGPVQLRLGRAPDDATVLTPRPANARGIWRTALLLRDLDTAVARLRSAGIALISAPQAMAMGPGVPELRFVCLPGPDHEVIELIESPLPPDPDDRDDQLPATD